MTKPTSFQDGKDEEIDNLAARGELIAYFGYGSLVNRATHRTQIVHAVPARLRGWRRCWRPRPDMPGFPAALLSLREDQDACCDGLLVFDHLQNLAAVDAREARYRRIAVPHERLETDAPIPSGCPVYVYLAETEIPPHPEPPKILQSYLDAVLQGFLQVHGEDGLRRFVAETDGFDTPLHLDRSSPAYPRAVALAEAEAALFDMLLAERLAASRAAGAADFVASAG